MQRFFLLFQSCYILFCCCNLFLDSFKALRRCPVLWQIHVRPTTAQADNLKIVYLSNLSKRYLLTLHPGFPFGLLSAQAFKSLLL